MDGSVLTVPHEVDGASAACGRRGKRRKASAPEGQPPGGADLAPV